MQFVPRQPDRNVNITPTSAIREFLVLAGGLMAIVLVLYLLLGFAVELLIPRLSPRFEQVLASSLLSKTMSGKIDAEKSQKLQSLLDRLQEHCARLPYHCTVKVIDSPRVNALAAPGGTIIVFSSLLDELSSENELTFVLGHEMGHFFHRDHLRGLGRGLVFAAISTALFGPHNQASRLAARFLNLTELRFSRQQETAADHFALDVLHCTYGHVGGALIFFKKLASMHHSRYAGVSFFSSHPLFPERMQDLQDYCRQQGFHNGRVTPLPEGW